MSTYETERKQLFDELMKNIKSNTKQARLYPVLGRDSKWNLKEQEIIREYNKNLQKLKEKYGVE